MEIKKDKRNLLKFVEGCLMGVAIGDAMGASVETHSHESIMALNSGLGVIGFMEPLERVQFGIKIGGLVIGGTTDDWQLTAVVARSLIHTHGKFDVADCAQRHVDELDSDITAWGWGGTTKKAIRDIRDGKRHPVNDQLPSAEPGKGCGNGVIMKISPIVIANVVRGASVADLWEDCKKLGMLTHPDSRAWLAAHAVAFVMRRAFLTTITTNDDIQNIINDVIVEIQLREFELSLRDDLLSTRLKKLTGVFFGSRDLHTEVGSGFHALETAPFCIGMFLKYPTNFREGMLVTTNWGGDTDTNASVYGALAGAHCGIVVIPSEWQSFNPKFQESIELAKLLCEIK